VKDYIGHISHQSGRLSFVAAALFDTHVLEFAGLEHFAAFQAFHVFGVLLTAHDLDAWVFAGWALNYLGAGWRHFRSHKSGDSIGKKVGEPVSPEFHGILDPSRALSRAEMLDDEQFLAGSHNSLA
jgi:hypothetical protein